MLSAIDRRLLSVARSLEAAFAYQREVDARHKILIVGVNAFQEAEEKPLDILEIDQAVEAEQIESLKRVKAERSNDDECAARWTRYAVPPRPKKNVMPALIDVARSRATVGEVMNALAEVYGRCDTAVV